MTHLLLPNASLIVPLPMPLMAAEVFRTNTSQIGTPTLNYGSVTAWSFVQVVFTTSGSGTGTIYIPYRIAHTLFGLRLTGKSLLNNIAKSAQTGSGDRKISVIGLARRTGSAGSAVVAMNSVVSVTADQLTGAANTTPSSIVTDIADTVLTVDAALYLAITVSHSATAATTWRIGVNSEQNQATFSVER